MASMSLCNNGGSFHRAYLARGPWPYRPYDPSKRPVEYMRKRKKQSRSGVDDVKLASLSSAEAETDQEEDLSEANTTNTCSSMETDSAPPIKLEDVIPPRTASFNDSNKKKKNKKKKLAKAN